MKSSTGSVLRFSQRLLSILVFLLFIKIIKEKGENKDKGIQTLYSSTTNTPGRQYNPDLHPVWTTPVSRVTRKPPALENWQDTRGNRRRRSCLHSQVNLRLTIFPILARTTIVTRSSISLPWRDTSFYTQQKHCQPPPSVRGPFLLQVEIRATLSTIQKRCHLSATSVIKRFLSQVSSKDTHSPIQEIRCLSATSVTKHSLGQIASGHTSSVIQERRCLPASSVTKHFLRKVN